MDHRSVLRADCSRCSALCCISLPFDRGPWFAFDKPANVSCRYLRHDHRCRIHDELGARGQGGCAAYDCYGAGQRITCELHAGSSWQRDPETRAAVLEAFRRLKRVHELRWLLHEAARLRLSSDQAAEREALLELLEPGCGFTLATLDALNLEHLERRSHLLLRCLVPEARRRLPLYSH